MTKQTSSFIVNGERITVVLELKPSEKSGFKTVDLKPLPKKAVTVSLTGSTVGSGGQIGDTLRGIGAGNADIQRLCDLWDRWHLNDLKAGNAAQNDCLALHPEAKSHDERVAVLTSEGLLESNGYKYGSAWLFEPVPAAAIQEIKSLLSKLNGKRIGAAPDVSDAPEVDGDIIDSRDVIKRIEIYREAVATFGVDPDIRESDLDEEALGDSFAEVSELVTELNALSDLESEASDSGDWEFGTTLIRESHFRDYAEQLAEDIGAINTDSNWPNNCIDWDEAARQLKQDYGSVTFKNETYYVRN